MLGVYLFVAFWVLVAFSLFFVAIRGGVGGARSALHTQERGARRVIGVTFAVFYVAFGVAIPLLFLTGNHANASKQVGGVRLTAAQRAGRELFGAKCAMCHTLAAANAYGQVGPNLDQLQPNYALVLHTLQYGCLPNVASSNPQYCLGYGVMPAGILQGRQADEVAKFVSRVASKG
jgi:mono/diheme cytochrome c family protein